MCLAVPGRVVEIVDGQDIAFRLGKVDFGGIRKDINLAYTPEAEVGKYVLVHVGFAYQQGHRRSRGAARLQVPRGDGRITGGTR